MATTTTLGDKLRAQAATASTTQATRSADALAKRLCEMLTENVGKTPVVTNASLALGPCTAQFREILRAMLAAEGVSASFDSPCRGCSGYGCSCADIDNAQWKVCAYL